MTIILPPGTNVRLWKLRRRVRKYLHGLRRNPNCNERRRYRDDTQVTLGEHTHLPPLIQGGHSFEQVSVPVEFFRIASWPTVRKEDLMYLRINPVDAEDPDA